MGGAHALLIPALILALAPRPSTPFLIPPALGVRSAPARVPGLGPRCSGGERGEGLEGLPRRELQDLAKQHGLKANAKSADIIAGLKEALGSKSSLAQGQGDTGSEGGGVSRVSEGLARDALSASADVSRGVGGASRGRAGEGSGSAGGGVGGAKRWGGEERQSTDDGRSRGGREGVWESRDDGRSRGGREGGWESRDEGRFRGGREGGSGRQGFSGSGYEGRERRQEYGNAGWGGRQGFDEGREGRPARGRGRDRSALEGIKLEAIVTELSLELGWQEMYRRTTIKCFATDIGKRPSVKSALKLLRASGNEWQRRKVEDLYLEVNGW